MKWGQKIAPYDPGQRNRKRAEDATTRGETRAAPIWGDGVRMKKLEKLIKEMEKLGKDSIHVNDAAVIMENSADGAGHMINSCKRFERIKPGHYKLLPKGNDSDHSIECKVKGVKVDKIIEFMARKGRTEIMLRDAAELTSSTTNNIYNQIMGDDRMVKCGRGRFGLATAHKPAPEHKPISAPVQNDNPDELSLDEKMARNKMSAGVPAPVQQDKPDESMSAKKDTTAQDDNREIEKRNKLIIDQRDLIEHLHTKISDINKKLDEQGAPTPTAQPVQDQEALKKMYRECNHHSLTEQDMPRYAQPAPEARNVITICICPHCGKQIIID